ncbi:FG-GAP-like repeat-containing protein [Terricaulis sp.]|uniref:FG-GAP-like repeat-containing protein n=1 Tax=Terricaulis sp. TaxID=2768686 RepID=UPI00378388AE
MPTIIPSPGSPGSANIFATIPLNQNISLAAGQRQYTTSPMFALYDHTAVFETLDFTLSNAGTMWIASTGIARLLFPWNFSQVTNTGLMVAQSNGGAASYVVNVGSTWIGGLNNSGRMFAISTAGDAATIVDYAQGALIYNSGVIAAQGAIDVGAITRMNGGQIVNTASGQILAEGRDVYAIMLISGHSGDVAGYYDVDNAGLIQAASINPAYASVGIFIGALGYMSIRNAGTITADIAVLIDSTGNGGVHRIFNLAGGHINGDIVLDGGNDYIENAGQIVGDVILGLNDDTIVNTGQIVGLASMGWGEDTFTGGDNADAVIADRGDDTLSGGGGADLLLGGRGDDAIVGGAGNDGLYGEFGSDVITTQGGDRVAAGSGDDTVVLGDLAFLDVDGGAGADTLVLPNVADVLDLQAAIASGRVHGFETIALPGAQELVIHAGDVGALTGGQQMRVTTVASSRVDLLGAWAAGAPAILDGVEYAVFTQGAATVLIAGDGIVSIVEAAPGGAGGLDAVAGGGVAPLPGSTAGANLTGSVTDMGATMEGPDVIEADEIWTSNVGGGTGGWALVNYGQVTSTGNGATGARPMGVMIANYGTISATVAGDGANLASNTSRYDTYGVTNSIQALVSNAIAASGFGANYGTITASSQASIAVASNGGGANYGTLTATSSQFVAVGVNGGNFVNAGDINVTGHYEAYGVVAGNLEFSNSGQITVTATGAGAHSIGVYVYYASGTGHLVNSGDITAEIAVRTQQMVNGNALVIENTGEIHGRIELNVQTNGTLARPDVVMNSGLIDGEIRLGGERDLYLGGSGTQLQGVLGEAGMDLIVGGAGGETLNGGADADALIGGGGADALTGGAGADVFVYRAATDSSAASFDTIADFETGVDRIDLTAIAPSAVALDFADGVTTLTALAANGTLVIRISGAVAAADVVTVAETAINGAAAADLLVATAGGSTLTGAGGDDLLVGSAANDILNGGAGVDIMAGGAGDDTYYVEYGEEGVRELLGDGVDTIILSAIYSAPYYMPDNVENLIVAGTYGNVVGNGLANTITGNASSGRIDGGAGADTMIGGSGSDQYIVDNILDVVIEDLGASTDDSIVTSVTYTLSENVENLTLADAAGAIDGFGNALANIISGNESGNVLHAGEGADTVYAGSGADLVYGDAGADGLFGQNGDDIIYGGGGNDVLTGGAHNDTLNGEGGFDTASYAVASTAASWIRDDGGAWIVSAASDGIDNVSGVEVLHFTDRDVYLDVAERSFSGNATSDVLFRRADGIMASWEVNGANVVSAAFLPAAGAEWRVLGTGDFDGDGRTDVAWQRDDGLVYTWRMNGGSVASSHALAGIGPEWSFLAVGDFDGDGREDFAWQRSDGLVYLWRMNGASIAGADAVTGLGAEWGLAGVGDFNGDGREDFLWRNSAGNTVIWHMNGAAFAGTGATSMQAGLEWEIAGVGDVDADGHDDIIMRRLSDGMVRVWQMDGASVASSTDVAAVDPAQWTIHNIGDYDGDGRADILWQDANGLVYVWLMNGAAIAGAGAVSGIGAEWEIIGGG